MSRLSRRTFLAATAAVGTTAAAFPPAASAGGTAQPTGLPGGPHDYTNILDLRGVPAAAHPGDANDNNPINIFADLGAWHAYALPTESDPASHGAFTGPLHIAQEYPWWLSAGFSRLRLSESGHDLDLSAGGKPVFTSLPGALRQEYDLGSGLTVRLDLVFALQPHRARPGAADQPRRGTAHPARLVDRFPATPCGRSAELRGTPRSSTRRREGGLRPGAPDVGVPDRRDRAVRRHAPAAGAHRGGRRHLPDRNHRTRRP